jgi:hypothetical protein
MKWFSIFMTAAALWIFAEASDAGRYDPTGPPDSSGRLVVKPDANTLDHDDPYVATYPAPERRWNEERRVPGSTERMIEKPDANTPGEGAPNDPFSDKRAPDSDGRVVEPDNNERF